MFKKIFKNNTQKGFTLLEMIIALAIFTVVAVIAVGALLKIMDANRKSLSLKTSINNLNFALESMSREMRVGSNYYCTTSYGAIPHNYTSTGCASVVTNSWTIAFRSSRRNNANNCNLIYAYRLDNGVLKKTEQSKSGNCTDALDNGNNTFQELISSDVVIEQSLVNVSVDPLLGQPWATFAFKGYTGIRVKERSDFSLQTSITQRLQ